MCTSVAATAQATQDDDNASEHSTLSGASSAKRFVDFVNSLHILAFHS